MKRRPGIYLSIALYSSYVALVCAVLIGCTLWLLEPTLPVDFSLSYHSIGPALFLLLVTGIAAICLPLVLAGRILSHITEEFRIGFSRIEREKIKIRLQIKEHLFSEVATLEEDFNRMVTMVSGRVVAIMRRTNELQAVLSGMVEVVLALDKRGRIVNMNPAAERLFNVTAKETLKKPISSVIKNEQCLVFIEEALRSPEPMSREIEINLEGTQYFQAQSSNLKELDTSSSGIIIVLNDVTNLRHLERVRQDFVANVSHELRTPITSIKGFVETLPKRGADLEFAKFQSDFRSLHGLV